MLIKIEDDKAETMPGEHQYIAFRSGDVIFAGVYRGDKKASPFCMEGGTPPVMVFEEWFPIRLWK